MRRIILPPVVSPAIQHFSTLSHKRHEYWGGGIAIEFEVLVLILSTLFVRTISYSK
jgi:hypothetical protein